jgi:ADP-heptose:LPS heptosyltransferase
LRQEGFDLAIDLHGGPRSAWLTWASGAARRIGYAIKGRSWMYTDVVPRAADLAPRHSVVNQWDLLQPLGIGECDPERNPVEMPDDGEAAARVSAGLSADGIAADAPLIVRLAEADPRRRILLTAGPSDVEAANRVFEAARARLRTPESLPPARDWSLAELRALIARAAVYIGGDSGPAHVAATTTTPIVELLGPTLAERSRPWRSPRLRAEIVDPGPLPCRPCDQRRCAPGDFRCLRSIAPERVIDAAERILKRESVTRLQV